MTQVISTYFEVWSGPKSEQHHFFSLTQVIIPTSPCCFLGSIPPHPSPASLPRWQRHPPTSSPVRPAQRTKGMMVIYASWGDHRDISWNIYNICILYIVDIYNIRHVVYIYIYTYLYMNNLMYHSWVRKSVRWGIYHQKNGHFVWEFHGNSHGFYLVGGFNPSEKNMKVSLWKNRIHVPNHQPVMIHPIFPRYFLWVSSPQQQSELTRKRRLCKVCRSSSWAWHGDETSHGTNRCSIRQVFRRTIT